MGAGREPGSATINVDPQVVEKIRIVVLHDVHHLGDRRGEVGDGSVSFQRRRSDAFEAARFKSVPDLISEPSSAGSAKPSARAISPSRRCRRSAYSSSTRGTRS